MITHHCKVLQIVLLQELLNLMIYFTPTMITHHCKVLQIVLLQELGKLCRSEEGTNLPQPLPQFAILPLESRNLFTLRLGCLAGEETLVCEVKCLTNGQRDLLRQFVTDKYEACVLVLICLLCNEAEKSLLRLVVRAVRNPV